MSLCPHGYTAFWDCPECEYPMGEKNAPVKRSDPRSKPIVILPEDPPYEALKALAGDPLILAASDEEWARWRYKAMRDVLLEPQHGEGP